MDCYSEDFRNTHHKHLLEMEGTKSKDSEEIKGMGGNIKESKSGSSNSDDPVAESGNSDDSGDEIGKSDSAGTKRSKSDDSGDDSSNSDHESGIKGGNSDDPEDESGQSDDSNTKSGSSNKPGALNENSVSPVSLSGNNDLEEPECASQAEIGCVMLPEHISESSPVETNLDIEEVDSPGKIHPTAKHKLKSFVSLTVYLFHYIMTIIITVIHYSNGDNLWAGLTLMFIMLPIFVSSLIATISAYCDDQSWWRLLVRIVGAPLLPVFILGYNIIMSINNANYTYDLQSKLSTAEWNASFMMLSEAMLEALPQSILQLHIVFKLMHAGIVIGALQWLTIVSCIIMLCYAVTTSFKFDEATTPPTITSRFIFFTGGLITFTARLVVACSYSSVHGALLLLPICTELFVSITMWSIISFCPCCYKYPPHDPDPGALLLWLQNSTMNGFTLSGLPVSLFNCVFAIGCFLLDVDQTIAIVTVILASASLVLNICIASLGPDDSFFSLSLSTCSRSTSLSACSKARIDWLVIKYGGKSNHY